MALGVPREESAEGDALETWARSWEMRLVRASPLPPAATGLLLSAVLIAFYAAVELLFGSPAPQGVPVVVAGLTENVLGFAVAAAICGYALAAGYLINSGNAACVAELEPHLSQSSKQRRPLPSASLGESRVWGACGILVGIIFGYSVDDAVRLLLRGLAFTTDALSSILVVPLAFFLATRAVYFTLADMRAIASREEHELAIDLLRPDHLVPLGCIALRASLLWIGAAALGSLSIVLTGGSAAESLAVAFLMAVAAGTFVIPVSGVHRRIRQAKDAELRRLRGEIRRDRERLLDLESQSSEAAQRLHAPLAYESRIQSAPEWPFDTPTLWRFFLYLSLPLASWLCGALVERAVDQVLG